MTNNTTNTTKIIKSVRICKEYILPKLYQTVGLSDEDVILNDDVLLYIIKNYTFEAGLRRISQLGLSYLVYPGANHSRFHHAIGCMHLMTKAISQIKKKK